MKRLLVMFMIALLAMGALAGVVSADGGKNRETVHPGSNTTNVENAIVFLVDGGTNTTCNISPREVGVDISAYIAQWASWSINADGWEWYVKKPGIYWTDCVTGTLKSNGAVTLTFYGFDDLQRSAQQPDEMPENGVNNTIQTEFGWTVGDYSATNPVNWVQAPLHNGEGDPPPFVFELPFADNQLLHNGFRWKLYNKISVVDCNSPGLYTMSGTVVLTLNNQAPWIVQETGEFDKDWFDPTVYSF